MLNDIKKSILSGLMIAVGGSVYMACRTINCGSMNLLWLGAILFSAGLFTICVYGFNLYTGKVGYIAYNFKDFAYIRLVLLIVIFNLLTTFLLGIVVAYVYPKIGAEAFKVYAPKLNMPLLKVFISGTFCGLLMFLAVDTWKQGKMIGCFLFVPTFIFAGFDHSIANSFYNGAALGHQIFADESFLLSNASDFKCFSVANALLVIVTVLGNALGGMLVPLMTRKWKEEK
ncbi:MAG: formate/nitrite transporter family protein [Treponema sp.]|nr:formate/nitrite transporter family protein [Candidatus Treponema equifaecale]